MSSRNDQLNAKNKAISILTDEERASLSLQYVHNKSTWQAGEILNKAHYKYLELKARSEHFIKLFSEYYLSYGTLIPEDIPNIDLDFILYLKFCIEQRLTIREACNRVSNQLYQKASTRDVEVILNMSTLESSPSIHAQNLLNLIREFDRWNNFRILPREIQEPSAFKRRNKGRYKKHLQISTSFNPYTYNRIREMFEVKKPKSKAGYLALIKADEPSKYLVIQISASEQNLKALSRASLYVFPNYSQADRFAEEVSSYFFNPNKDPKLGLKFWPNFRALIKLALNFETINNIAPTRRGLTTALKDLDEKLTRKLRGELR